MTNREGRCLTSKILTIKFSLLDEAKEIKIDDLIKEINQAFSDDLRKHLNGQGQQK